MTAFRVDLCLESLKGREGLLRVEVEVFSSFILSNFWSFFIY